MFQLFYYFIFCLLFLCVGCAPERDKPILANKDATKGHIIPYQEGKLWGFYDTQENKITLKPQYDFIAVGKMPHIFAFSHQGKWGVINSLGEEIISPTYQHIEVFYTYLIANDFQGKHILYAPSGRLLASNVYILQEILENEEDTKPTLAVFERNGRQGLIDLLTGKYVMPPIYIHIEAKQPLFGKKWLGAKEEEKEGFCLHTIEGVRLSTQTYLSIETGKTLYSVVMCGKNKYGIIDKKGVLSVACQYKKITFPTDTLTTFQAQNGKWGLINVKNGKIIKKPLYSSPEKVYKNKP